MKCLQCAHPIANPETRDQLLPPKPLQKEPENIGQKWLKLIGTSILVVIVIVMVKDLFASITNYTKGTSEATKELSKSYDNYQNALSTKYSMSDYNQIATGMSYSQVKTILGSNEGKELSRVDIKGAPLTVSYQWQNADGSNIIVMFQDDAVTTKAQALLK